MKRIFYNAFLIIVFLSLFSPSFLSFSHSSAFFVEWRTCSPSNVLFRMMSINVRSEEAGKITGDRASLASQLLTETRGTLQKADARPAACSGGGSSHSSTLEVPNEVLTEVGVVAGAHEALCSRLSWHVPGNTKSSSEEGCALKWRAHIRRPTATWKECSLTFLVITD